MQTTATVCGCGCHVVQTMGKNMLGQNTGQEFYTVETIGNKRKTATVLYLHRCNVWQGATATATGTTLATLAQTLFN